MKREITFQQVDVTTGEIIYTTRAFYNDQIPEHKKKYMSMCEAFYKKHFSNPMLSLSLSVTFTDIHSELDLPF